MPAALERVHGTAIAVDGAAILIRGPSGSGKSDLALRCLTAGISDLVPRAAQLVADDQVDLTLNGGDISVSAPSTIVGKLEVRGLGILAVPSVNGVLRLVADIAPPQKVDRMPDFPATVPLLGVDVPHIRIAPFEHSAPIKLLLALKRAVSARD